MFRIMHKDDEFIAVYNKIYCVLLKILFGKDTYSCQISNYYPKRGAGTNTVHIQVLYHAHSTPVLGIGYFTIYTICTVKTVPSFTM